MQALKKQDLTQDGLQYVDNEPEPKVGHQDVLRVEARRPAGAAPVAGLGKAGYSALVAADPAVLPGGVGPGVEVGWLLDGQRLAVLRLRLRPEATPQDQQAIMPSLVELAKRLTV